MKQPELGRYITSVREMKGLTQEEVVSQCNISVRTLQRIESGKVQPRSYTLKAIAVVLDCNLFTSSDSSEDRSPDSAYVSIFNQTCDYIKDLFNLKTSKMKKLSILSTATFVLVFSLYTIGSKCYAQQVKNTVEYVKDNSRGFEIRIPSGLKGYGTYFSNDTLNVRAGKDIIKEHNGSLFLNNKFVGYVNQGDTVMYKKGSLLNKKVLVIKPYTPKPSYINNGVIYVTPYKLDKVVNDEDGDHFAINQYILREKDNQIYLNGKYQGNAFANDTVFFKNGKIEIKYASKD